MNSRSHHLELPSLPQNPSGKNRQHLPKFGPLFQISILCQVITLKLLQSSSRRKIQSSLHSILPSFNSYFPLQFSFDIFSHFLLLPTQISPPTTELSQELKLVTWLLFSSLAIDLVRGCLNLPSKVHFLSFSPAQGPTVLPTV